MSFSVFGQVIDERFLNHRLRSTSLAGIVGALVSLGLFAYHFYWQHVWNWDLLAVAITFVAVKLSVLAWYRLTD